MAKEREWPSVKRQPEAYYLTGDGYQRSNRSVAGPLRSGNAVGVGSRGAAAATGRDEERSDFGMDRVSPREFDVMGTSMRRYGPDHESDLVSRQIRGSNRRRDR
jgi:hypothetical protein